MYVEAGKQIKQIRLDKKLKRNELSKLSGISEGQITNIEKGRMKPGVLTLKKLADALGVNYNLIYKIYF